MCQVEHAGVADAARRRDPLQLPQARIMHQLRALNAIRYQVGEQGYNLAHEYAGELAALIKSQAFALSKHCLPMIAVPETTVSA
jgi:hypothetical protein